MNKVVSTIIMLFSFTFVFGQSVDQTNGNIIGFNRIVTGANDWMDIQLNGTGSSFKIHDNTNGENWVRWDAGSSYTHFLKDIYLSTGKIGIGISNPKNKLHIVNTSVGLQNASDGRILGVFENSGGARILIGTDSNSGSAINFGDSDAWNSGEIYYDHSKDEMKFSINNVVRMAILNNGNVGIGTTFTNSHKLAVEGSIGAREIQVEASGWSDFVFDEDYELKSIEEIEQYIKENGHLPEIPDQETVEKNGVNLGEMNAKLLQKIEELTLYLIEEHKTNKTLYKEVEQLKREVSVLKNK